MKNYKQILEAINRGIQLALDDFDDEEQIQNIKSKQVQNRDYAFEEINNFVDLGLPSGTLWNAYNLGVDPNHLDQYQYWNGGYYQWGESEPAFNQLTDNEIIKNKFLAVINQKYLYLQKKAMPKKQYLIKEKKKIHVHYVLI